MRGGVTVARLSLEEKIGVQIPAPQQAYAPRVTRVPRKARVFLQKCYFDIMSMPLHPF